MLSCKLSTFRQNILNKMHKLETLLMYNLKVLSFSCDFFQIYLQINTCFDIFKMNLIIFIDVIKFTAYISNKHQFKFLYRFCIFFIDFIHEITIS